MLSERHLGDTELGGGRLVLCRNDARVAKTILSRNPTRGGIQARRWPNGLLSSC